MQRLQRSTTGALLLFLVIQGFSPLVQARTGCSAEPSKGAACCCRQADATRDDCLMCKKSHDGAVRCGCGCQGRPADATASPAFDLLAVLPDRVPAFVDPLTSLLAVAPVEALPSLRPIPLAPPPWRLSTPFASC